MRVLLAAAALLLALPAAATAGEIHYGYLESGPYLDYVASPGELNRFAQKFGVTKLIDRDSKRYAELGLGTSRLSDQHWLDKLAEEPLLLRMPLVRCQGKLSVGLAEDEWKAWISSPTP